MVVQGPDECVTLAIFCRRDWRFRLDDRVDTAHYARVRKKPEARNITWVSLRTSMGDFSSDLEKDVILHLPLWAFSVVRHLERGQASYIVQRGSLMAT